jgi:large repetitive protein
MSVRRHLPVLAALAAALALVAATAAPAGASGSPPVANWDSYSGRQGQKLEVAAPGVLANDTDPEGDPLTARLSWSEPAYGTVELADDGSFVYIPDSPHPGYDSFTYQAFDGTSLSHTQYVSVTLWGAPIATPDRYFLLGQRYLDVPAEAGPLVNDHGEPPMRMRLTSRPRHGTVSIGRDGSFRYAPFRRFVGTDSFEYRARDASGTFSKPAEVTIRVAHTNTAPVALPDAFEVLEDTSLSVAAPGLLANDQDADGDPLRVEVVDWPAEGSLDVREDGSFEYLTDTNQDNNASFTYRVTDDFTWSEPVTVFIDVIADNDPPIAESDSYWLLRDEELTVGAPGVLENDYDPVEFDNPLVWALETPVAHGTLTLETDGSFVYVPDPGYVGSDFFVYRVGDSGGAGGTATVSLDIAEP